MSNVVLKIKNTDISNIACLHGELLGFLHGLTNSFSGTPINHEYVKSLEERLRKLELTKYMTRVEHEEIEPHNVEVNMIGKFNSDYHEILNIANSYIFMLNLLEQVAYDIIKQKKTITTDILDGIVCEVRNYKSWNNADAFCYIQGISDREVSVYGIEYPGRSFTFEINDLNLFIEEDLNFIKEKLVEIIKRKDSTFKI